MEVLFMIKVENIQVHGFEAAVRGMRNPLESWSRSDSVGETIGDADLELMRKLYKAGTEHRKYLRMITVTMDVTAPLYWWKEEETYRVGTVSNSCSTMHKLTAKKFELQDFSFDKIDIYDMRASRAAYGVVEVLNEYRDAYLKETDETKKKKLWYTMIQLLPSSYNQKRTLFMNYEVVMNIINQRSGHKLDEWNEFVKIIFNLPYIAEIRGEI
jgi:hypothetical protein